MSKEGDVLSPMQRFWRLLKPDQKEIRNVYVYAIFNGLIGLSLPLGIQAIVNLIQGGQMNTSWIVLVTLVVLGVAITGILQIFQLRITEDLQQKIFARAALEFGFRIPRIRLEALYRYHAPELMNRFFDIMSVQKGLSKILIDFSAASLQVLFGLILLSLYHPFFILFSLVLLLLVYVIFRFTAAKGLQTSLEESKHKYAVAHWLEELARTSDTFKLAGTTSLPLEKADREVEKYLVAREDHFRILKQQYSMMVVFKALVATGLLAIGGILVMEQVMNIGQFIAAEIVILLVMASVEKLILSLETIYDVLTALAKVGQVTDLELDDNEGEDLQQFCQGVGMEVGLKNVSFQYPGSDKTVLDQINLEIPCGQKVVITGENSAGKSTLLHLMAGLYRPSEGTVSLQGYNRASLQLSSIHDATGDALSDEELFEGTLLENIALGRNDISLTDVKWAVDKMQLKPYVDGLQKGYRTMLSPRGKSLPRSTVQKILLARSIVHQPKLLLLEDALEHLDRKDKEQIVDFLTDSQSPWTMVAVSSDAYLQKKADRVVILKEGSVSNSSESKPAKS